MDNDVLSEYHKKPSLGVLLDLGGKEDVYSVDGRADSTVRVQSGVEVFIDAKAKDMRKLLKELERR